MGVPSEKFFDFVVHRRHELDGGVRNRLEQFDDIFREFGPPACSEVAVDNARGVLSSHVSSLRWRFGPWALQAHPTRGLYLGHSMFGVKSLKAFSAASGLTVEDCGSSKSSDDVSDKWFFVAAGEHDSCSSRTLRAELPQFEAAKASLAATIGELDAALPNMMLCKPSLMAGAFARVGVGSAQCSLPPRGAAGD